MLQAALALERAFTTWYAHNNYNQTSGKIMRFLREFSEDH